MIKCMAAIGPVALRGLLTAPASWSQEKEKKHYLKRGTHTRLILQGQRLTALTLALYTIIVAVRKHQ